MLDGIPLGRAGGIVRDCHFQREWVTETGLELMLPCTTGRPIAPTVIGEDEEFVRVRITPTSFVFPPVGDRVGGKGGGVMGDAYDDVAAIGYSVQYPIGHGYRVGLASEVVVLDWDGGFVPSGTRIFKGADQFLFLAIHTDDRCSRFCKGGAELFDVSELLIPYTPGRGRAAGEFLVVDPEFILQGIQQSGNGPGTGVKATPFEFLTDLGGCFARPFETGDWIACCSGRHQLF